MKIIEAETGDTLKLFIEQLIATAKELKEPIQTKFNRIEFIVNPDDTAEALLEGYNNAYINQATYQLELAHIDNYLATARQTFDRLIMQLPDLDFDNDVAVLDWIYELQDPSDILCDKSQAGFIVETFAAHNYFPGVNCGPDYQADDRENVARHLIGQALEFLQTSGAIHQVAGTRIEEWKEKFLSAAA